MVNDFLFELGSEELPSAAVWPLADALANNLIANLAKANLTHGEVHRYASPRRLAVLIHDVQVNQPDQKIARRGPACAAATDSTGQYTPALLGFAKSCGVTVGELFTIKTDKGDWWAYEANIAGKTTRELLPTILKDALATLPIAKPMRWGNSDIEFARPVHWSVLLFGHEIVKAEVLGVTTGRTSFGHRFHHPQAIELATPRSYVAQLQEAYVLVDFNQRQQIICDQVQALAKQQNLHAIMPETLVNEVTSIVEWPQALLASFAAKFLDVPTEALIAAMQVHQKCFALQDNQGNLSPHFITVANIASSNPAQVVLGNEKVMRARLSDAAFFYHQDRKQPLSAYQAATNNVVFQTRLGSLHDKAKRLQKLMDYLTQPLQLEKQHALRAAALSKCDLMTGMVGEFPELQGLMGYYYACHDHENKAVALALNEQYMPRFATDQLPESPLGIALSLADRLDTLVGNFAIGQKPTGMKDPFKLRRHALAVVRLLTLIPVELSLAQLIDCALQGYSETLTSAGDVQQLQPFILERLQSFYQGQEITHDVIQAVRSRQNDWFFDLDKRMKAMVNFVDLPEAISLSAACKRVNNLLNQAAMSLDNCTIEENLFDHAAEKVLFQQLHRVEQEIAPLYGVAEYGKILNHLASLRPAVDAFFEQVMVMVDNQAVKENRLKLLTRLQKLLQGVADISLLQLTS